MLRFLPLLIIPGVILSLLLYLPIRQEILYSFHLSGDPTTSCCGDPSEIAKSTGDFQANADQPVFEGQSLNYPQQLASLPDPNPNVLGETTNANGETKWIEVDLATQTLRAYEGNKIVREFLISSGRWAPTPTGDFHIWYKTKYQRMVGGSKALGTYYDLPNVPFNMFFSGGNAIHGAYWHNNFGHPMSHGCVNAPVDQAQWLFDWTGPNLPAGQNYVKATADNPGTRVFVH